MTNFKMKAVVVTQLTKFIAEEAIPDGSRSNFKMSMTLAGRPIAIVKRRRRFRDGEKIQQTRNASMPPRSTF